MIESGRPASRQSGARIWPGGDGIDIALLPLEPEDLSTIFGVPTESGVEEGLGDWMAVGGSLPSGATIEIIHYPARLGPKGVILRIDAGASFTSVLDEALAIANLSRASLPWVSPRVE